MQTSNKIAFEMDIYLLPNYLIKEEMSSSGIQECNSDLECI